MKGIAAPSLRKVDPDHEEHIDNKDPATHGGRLRERDWQYERERERAASAEVAPAVSSEGAITAEITSALDRCTY